MKTEKIIYLLFGVLLFSGCSEYEIKTYNLYDRINFVTTDAYGQESRDPEDMLFERNFGINPLGDRLKVDTLVIEVKAQGNVADNDRKIAFKVVPADCGIEVESIGTYVLPGGEDKCKLKLLVKRPVLRDTVLEGKLTFDYVLSDFEAGVDEQQYYILRCSDIVNMEVMNMDDWAWGMFFEYDLGSWSNIKARFIINVLGITDFDTWYWVSPAQKSALVDALEAYKSDPSNLPLYDETKLPEKVWISF